MRASDSSKILRIKGEFVSGVGFIQDYVEFYFDGMILRSLSNPIIKVGGKEYAFPDEGSRDALCLLIGKKVLELFYDDKEKIEVSFTDSLILRIPLNNPNAGPESAHFLPGENEFLGVWY